MFETYYYIDEEKIDCYLSDFTRHSKVKNRKLSVEVSLPFIKFSSAGEWSKDIAELTPRQKIILLESMLDCNESYIYSDLSRPDIDVCKIPVNTFVKLHCKLIVPEMIDLINGLSSLLTGSLGDFAKGQISPTQDEDNAKILFKLFSEKKLSVPIITNGDSKCVAEINIDNLIGCNESDFWDDVADGCEVIAKVTRNHTRDSKVKVFDIGTYFFGLSRAMRRNIPNYESDPKYNVFEEDVKFKLEILAIRK